MIPSALGALLLNVITQGMCVRGVNRLTTVSLSLNLSVMRLMIQRVNSTTVNLVLTIRKAVSLAISVWFYGSGANAGLLTGGAMVLGPFIYILDSRQG
jgi:UDP-xylose/UDP-N-acetylglucosamine transporter B4